VGYDVEVSEDYLAIIFVHEAGGNVFLRNVGNGVQFHTVPTPQNRIDIKNCFAKYPVPY
jgi:hypothetical protein